MFIAPNFGGNRYGQSHTTKISQYGSGYPGYPGLAATRIEAASSVYSRIHGSAVDCASDWIRCLAACADPLREKVRTAQPKQPNSCGGDPWCPHVRDMFCWPGPP